MYNNVRMQKRQNIIGWALTGPSVLWLLVFFLIPLGIVFVYSFKQNIYVAEKVIFSLEDQGLSDLLDHRSIPKILTDAFRGVDKELLPDAQVDVLKPGHKWRISSGSNYYYIKLEDDKLHVVPSVMEGRLRKLLFSVDTSLKDSLDRCQLTNKLQEEFKKNNFLLSDHSLIDVKSQGSEWSINDLVNKRKYLLLQEGNKLNVYIYSITLSNYLQALNPIYLHAIVRSFWIAIANTVICLIIGYPVAYYISTRSQRLKNILLILVILPFWTNFLVRTYAWMVVLRGEGLINTVLMKLGLIEEPLQLLFTNGAVLTGLVYGYLPFMILPLYASIEKLNPSLLEASYDLGANKIQSFLRITLPLTLPGITAGSILVFIPSLGAFVTPDLLGGAKTMMIGNLIQNQFLKVRNYPFGSALSFVLLSVVLILIFIYIKITERHELQEY